MKKIFTLAMLACLSMGAWADGLEASTNVSTPEHVYLIHRATSSSELYWNASGANVNAASAAKFAFIAGSKNDEYYVYSMDAAKFLSYDNSSFSSGKNKAQLVDTQAEAKSWQITSTTRNAVSCFQMQPYNADGTVASFYANWYSGTSGNTSIGFWTDAASADDGSAWALEELNDANATALQTKIMAAFVGINSKKVGYPYYNIVEDTPAANQTAVDNLANYAINEAVSASNYADALAKYNAVLALTSVNMPASGKAYKLNFVHNNASNTKRYIKYDANGLGLTTEASEATTILFTEVDPTNHKFIMSLSDGNLVTWTGDGNEGFKVDAATAKGYSTMVANQGGNDDWNLCWFTNQGTSEGELGTIKMISPRHASSATNSCWVISNEGAWAKANEASFFQNNGATSALQFEEVAGVTGATDGYKDGVEKYTLYTTAKENNTTYASHFGEGLGKYSYTDKESAVQTSGYMDAVKACTTLDEERSVVNSIVLNMPEGGKFYTFRGVQSTKYLGIKDDGSYGEVADASASTIWYVTKNADKYNLLSYKNGQYSNGESIAAVGAPGMNYTITNAINGSDNALLGQYGLMSPEGYFACSWGHGTVQGITNAKTADDWSGWTLEEVTSLPIKVNKVEGAYYGTINLPVAVTIPAGLKAYSAVADGSVLTLTNVVKNGVLAANTPVILYSETDVTSLAIADAAGTAAVGNELLGTVAATTVGANENYVLSNASGIGFYKYNNTTMPGFKAYLPATAKASANKLAFNFEDVLTAIQAIESNNCSAEIFDLQGRRLNQAQKGMNIINGHKVLVK